MDPKKLHEPVWVIRITACGPVDYYNNQTQAPPKAVADNQRQPKPLLPNLWSWLVVSGREGTLNEDRARLLEDTGRALKETADYESAVRLAARCGVPDLADLVVLVAQRDKRDYRLEVAHADSGKERQVVDLLTPALPVLMRAASRDINQGRQFRWVPVVNGTSTRFLRHDPELRRLLGALEIRSLMVVPLRSGGRILGAMAFARSGEARPYSAADLALAQILARRAAVAMDRAELHESSPDERARRDRLEDAFQKWLRIFELAAWPAAIVDGADQRIDAVNPAFARMHGYVDSASLIGRLFTDLLPSDRASEPVRWLTHADGRPEAYESVHLRADGKPFPVLTDVTALGTGPGTPLYVVTVHDLSELKRTEDRLRQAQRMEAVGRLAGGVAHEVNNMMTIVLGFADLLAAGVDLPPERKRDVEEIRKGALRAARVTQQLLALSRQQVLQRVDLQLNEVVSEMAPVLRLLLPANVQVETALSPVPVGVRADRAQLDQVLINLALNARDAMPSGGTLRLATSSRYLDAQDGHRLIGIPIPRNQYASLSVSDTGHGMDQVTLGRVFEPFFTTKPAGSGTGLGLATVYGIVKQSGGFVWVESTPGEGTTFTVCLPQIERRPSHAVQEESAGSPPQRRTGATVLIVEDEDGVRELARRVLEQEGCRVLDVRSGEEAIVTLGMFGSEVELVLSDVILPDMDVTELESRIRAYRAELPVLYMSGHPRDEMVQRGLLAADRPFIQKPFTPEELADVVWRKMGASTARGGPVTT